MLTKFQNSGQQVSTPSYESLPDSGVLLTVKTDFENYVSSTINDQVEAILSDPKTNLSSVG